MATDDPDTKTRTSNRNTELGDRACFCADCGWARRYHPGAVEPPTECPACASERVVVHCPACGEDILSIMAVECDVCEAPLRDPEVNGVRIHRPKRVGVVRTVRLEREAHAAEGTG